MGVQKLSNEDLLEQYTDMVRWSHYDPMGASRPSSFEIEDLRAELRRRMQAGAPVNQDD